jgi:hypothetical protein
MHNLGPQRALEIAAELGCSCLFPSSLESSLDEPYVRQMTGGGLCSVMTVKTAIKEDATSQSALQAHENIVARRAATLPRHPHKRALKADEALELAELKVEATERSRKRTKAAEQGVIFVRSSVHKRKPVSALSTSLHMFDSSTRMRLDKDNMATAMSSVHAQPILLVPELDKPRASKKELSGKELRTSELQWQPSQQPLSFLLQDLETLQAQAQVQDQALGQDQVAQAEGSKPKRRRISKKMREAQAIEEYQATQAPPQYDPFEGIDYAKMDGAAAAAAEAALGQGQFVFHPLSPMPNTYSPNNYMQPLPEPQSSLYCGHPSAFPSAYPSSAHPSSGYPSSGYQLQQHPRKLSVSSLGYEFPSKDPYDEVFGLAD